MSAPVHSLPIFRWHHRVLGVVWALCGLVAVGNMLLHPSWVEYQYWIVLFVLAAYVMTGIGFILGRAWARRTMGVLMAVAVIWFLDMMLMCSFVGNRQGVWVMFIALGIAGYTLLFLAISAAWCSVDQL